MYYYMDKFDYSKFKNVNVDKYLDELKGKEPNIKNDTMTEEEFYALPLNDLYIKRQIKKKLEDEKTPEEKAEDYKEYRIKTDASIKAMLIKDPDVFKLPTEHERRLNQLEYEKDLKIVSEVKDYKDKKEMIEVINKISEYVEARNNEVDTTDEEDSDTSNENNNID